YLSIVRASRPHFQRTVYTPDHGTGSSGLGGFSPSDRIDFSVRATTPSRGRTARSWTRTREAGWLQGWRWSCQRAAGRRTAGRFARSAWGHAKAWPSEEAIKFWSRPCSQSGFGRITWSAGRGLCRSSESPRELLLRGVAYRLVMAPDRSCSHGPATPVVAGRLRSSEGGAGQLFVRQRSSRAVDPLGFRRRLGHDLP